MFSNGQMLPHVQPQPQGRLGAFSCSASIVGGYLGRRASACQQCLPSPKNRIAESLEYGCLLLKMCYSTQSLSIVVSIQTLCQRPSDFYLCHLPFLFNSNEKLHLAWKLDSPFSWFSGRSSFIMFPSDFDVSALSFQFWLWNSISFNSSIHFSHHSQVQV